MSRLPRLIYSLMTKKENLQRMFCAFMFNPLRSGWCNKLFLHHVHSQLKTGTVQFLLEGMFHSELGSSND